MNARTIIIGVSGALVAVMLGFIGFIALGLGASSDLSSMTRTEKMATSLEKVHNDAVKNLDRAMRLAAFVSEARRRLAVEDTGSFLATAAPASRKTLMAGRSEAPTPEPLTNSAAPATGLAGIVVSPAGNMAVINGDVYQVGQYAAGRKIVRITNESVVFESSSGTRSELGLTGWSQEGKKR